MSLLQERINVRSRSQESERERALSNFPDFPFRLGSQTFLNVEAFVQGIKYPEGDPLRGAIFQMAGREAKRLSPQRPPSHVEWEGQWIEYGSLEHRRLEAAAIFAKFDQNEEAYELLLATGDIPLFHDLGKPENSTTALPAAVFTQILTETREHFFGELGVPPASDTPAVYVTPGVIQYARA